MDKRWVIEVTEKLKTIEFSKYKKYAKYAITAVAVVIALAFFGHSGESSDITKEYSDGSLQTSAVQEQQNISDDEQNLTLSDNNAENNSEQNQVINDVYVDIEGMVKKPGVYKVPAGSRMYEVIELAGGLMANADTTNINQAEEVTDGEKITIYEIGESGTSSSESNNQVSQYVNNSREGEMNTPGLTADGHININTADSAGLQEIPGVGPATADKIISYRENSGGFKSIEEIKNVNGIGEKTFEKIKEMITI